MPIVLNPRRLLAKNRAVVDRLPKAREAAMVEVARVMTHSLARLSPRDTNRYVRGWIEAGAGAGVRDVGKPALRKSKRRGQIMNALVAQVAAQQRMVNIKEAQLRAIAAAPARKGSSPTSTKRYQRTLDQLTAARARLEKAKDSLRRFAGNDGALAIARKYSNVLSGNQRHISGKALNIEVRDVVYGGIGGIAHGPNRSALKLHNLEPHSTPLERKRHVLAAAKHATKGYATRSLRKKFLEQARQRWGLAGRR